MPTEDGKLADEETAKANTWLADRWKANRCPICHESDWVAERYLARLDVADEGVVRAPMHFPVLVVFCRNCGNTVLLNAVVVGLIPMEAPAEEGSTAEERLASTPHEEVEGG